MFNPSELIGSPESMIDSTIEHAMVPVAMARVAAKLVAFLSIMEVLYAGQMLSVVDR